MKKRRAKARLSPRRQRAEFLQREAFYDHLTAAAFEMRVGSPEAAEREARRALRIAPGHPEATVLLCGILHRTGRHREALSFLREALESEPKDPILLYDFALCASTLDRLDEAESAIRRLHQRLEQDPASARGQMAVLRRGARQVLRDIGKRRPRIAPAAGPRRSLNDSPHPSPGGRGEPAGPPPGQRSLFELESAQSIRAPRPLAGPDSRDGGPASLPGLAASAPAARAAPVPAWSAAGAARPACAIRFEEAPSALSLWNDVPWRDEIEERDLLLEAEGIRRVTQFEEMLCLPELRGVERFEYQVETARKILRRLNGRALLCDEVGLGKTIEAGMVIKEYLLRGLARSVLVLTPPGLVRQWRDEMSEKFSLDFVLWDERARVGSSSSAPLLVIVSLALARRPQHFDWFAGREWDMVVVDEAHHVRRRSTRSWELVNALRKRFLLLLSATPIHNNLMELYELVTLVQPGLLGTQAEFRRRFGDGKGERRAANPEALREALLEVMVRNTRAHADVALPRRLATTLLLDPYPSESEAYRAASEFARRAYPGANVTARMSLRHLLECAGSGPRALAAAAERKLIGRGATSGASRTVPEPRPGTLDTTGAEEASPPEPGAPGEDREIRSLDDEGMRLLRLTSEAASAGRSAKTDRLLQLLAASEDQVVVFCRYRATLADLSERLSGVGIPHVLYHGALTRSEKDRAIETFSGGARVLLSTESGGEGRNMQFCRAMVNYDLPWDPMLIEQRVGRLHRIGQRREVFIFNLVLAGTLEEELLRILEEKIHLFELLVGEVDSILGHLDRREEFAEIILDLWAGSRGDEERRRRFEEFGRDLETARRSYEGEKSLDEAIFSDGLEV